MTFVVEAEEQAGKRDDNREMALAHAPPERVSFRTRANTYEKFSGKIFGRPGAALPCYCETDGMRAARRRTVIVPRA